MCFIYKILLVVCCDTWCFLYFILLLLTCFSYIFLKKKTIHAYYEQNKLGTKIQWYYYYKSNNTDSSFLQTHITWKKKKNKMKQEVKRGKCTRVLEKKKCKENSKCTTKLILIWLIFESASRMYSQLHNRKQNWMLSEVDCHKKHPKDNKKKHFVLFFSILMSCVYS